MAAGNSGSFTISGTKYMSAKCYWSETYDVNANTHIVSIDKVCLISTNWYGFTYYPNGTISVGGTNVVSFSSSSGGHSCTINSQNAEYQINASSGYSASPWYSGTITGNADGSCSVTITLNFMGFTVNGSGANGFSINGSSTVTLYTIPRKSSVSMNAATMGTAATITISRASSSFTHTLTYSFGSASGTIATKTTSTSVSWTPPLTLANQIPSSTSGTVTITCQTYSGTTLIGTSTKTATLSVPTSVKPSFTSITATRVDGTVPSSWGIYVQNKSKATLAITGAAGSYGSTISAYSISGGGFSSTASSYTTGFLTSSGTITFTGKVQDSRGRWSDEKTVSISVVAYSPPAFSKYQTQRCTSNGTVSTNGTYGKGTVTFSYSDCSNKNTITTAIAYKKTSASSYTTTTTTFTTGTAVVFGGGNLATDFTYDIRYTLTDAFGSVTVVDKLSTASVVMDFKAGGLGVAVGKVSETDKCLEVSNDWLTKTGAITAEGNIKPATHNGFSLGASTQQFSSIFGRYHRMYDSGQSYGGMTLNNIGTADALGDARLILGNNVAQGTDKNARGLFYMYGQNTGYHCVIPTAGTSNVSNYLPASTGYLVSSGSTSAAVGGTAKPVYVTSGGVATALSATVGGTTQPVYLNAGTVSALTSVAVAYGGTGATTAANARSNLGIKATSLYSGTLTTGSTTFSTGYKLYVIIGQVSSSGSRCAFVIPGSMITTSAVGYQFADESYYYSFNLSYSGSTVTLAYRGRSSSGQILAVYGIN